MRKIQFQDKILAAFDNALRTLSASHRKPPFHPGDACQEPEISPAERRISEQLMRVNHTGEVCAQALYQGQLLFAQDTETAAQLEKASEEETYHLVWCEKRLQQLDGRTSYLNPFFYVSSFAFGAAASFWGDATSLGFLAETENQVEQHLNKHLEKLPQNDEKSRAIVTQMRDDEANHRHTAIDLGGKDLPVTLKRAMKLAAKVMTSTTRFI